MGQFDIVRLKGGELAIILQHRLLDDLDTRVVAPLFLVSSIVPAEHLHPVLRIGRRKYLLATEKLSVIAKHDIEAVIGSAVEREYDIRRAVDILFCGI